MDPDDRELEIRMAANYAVFNAGYAASEEFKKLTASLTKAEELYFSECLKKFQAAQRLYNSPMNTGAGAALPAAGAAGGAGAVAYAGAAAPLVLVSGEPTGINPATAADIVKAAMDARKSDTTKTCYASIGTTHSSGSMTFPGASVGGGPTMHAERNAMRKVCDHYGVVYGGGDSKAIGQALAAKGVTINWIYTDLPPCPTACEGWVKPLGAKAIYFAETLINWYSKSPHVPSEAKQWEDFLKSIGLG